jgi:hypothetical protein
LLLYEFGEWDELVRERDELLIWDRSQGSTQIEVMVLMAAAPALAQRGAVDEAERGVSIFVPRARDIGDPQALGPALHVGAFVHALCGKLGEATALVEDFERVTRKQPNWRADGLRNCIRVCVAGGRFELADTLLEGAEGAIPNLATRATLTTASAMLAEARGRGNDAAALYREAVTGWAEWGSVLERAYALLGLGRCGDRAAEREAAAMFEQLGAVPFAALAA